MQKLKSKRYYGMTVSQIGILVGTAALLMCVAGAAFFFVLTSAPKAQPPAAATNAILQTPTPRVQGSSAGRTPTPTNPGGAVATSVPPVDWVEFQTPGATLWLPSKFVGGDLVRNRADTFATIVRLGRYYRDSVNAIERADKETVLWMVDKTIIKLNDFVTTVNAKHIISTEDTSLDDYIQSYWDGNVQGTPVAMLFTLNETKKLTLLGREAKRLTYSFTDTSHGMIVLTYYIKDGADIWVINYLLNPNEYIDMLPMVEQSIQTFSLVK